MNNFFTEKKGYNKKEVDIHIETIKTSYDKTLSEQKDRIFELKNAIVKFEEENKELKMKSDLISKSIIAAVEKAEEIDKVAKIKYNEEMGQLKAFHDRWVNHYQRILAKYPLDEDLINVKKFDKGIKDILQTNSIDAFDKFEIEPPKGVDSTVNDKKEDSYMDDYFANESERLQRQVELEMQDQNKEDYIQENKENIDSVNKLINEIKTNQQSNNDNKCEVINSRGKTVRIAEIDKNATSGFMFTEALNPQQELEDILKDLGIVRK